MEHRAVSVLEAWKQQANDGKAERIVEKNHTEPPSYNSKFSGCVR